LFTGGAGVLAGAIARGLGRAGARIVLTDIAPLEVRLQELRQLGIEVYGYRMDVLPSNSRLPTSASWRR
jgi:NAD(P)-dependent dehydrogenase (short-subunit alcohol dehydrogenase family)